MAQLDVERHHFAFLPVFGGIGVGVEHGVAGHGGLVKRYSHCVGIAKAAVGSVQHEVGQVAAAGGVGALFAGRLGASHEFDGHRTAVVVADRSDG